MKVNVNDLISIYEKEVSKNTKNKTKVYKFERNKMENIYDIKNILESNRYMIIKYHIFYVSEPKYRVIMSLSIKDKLINHYASRFILLPKLDKYLDMRNCATRKNMGYDYAIKLLKKYMEINKKYDKFYILKIDISKYFYSIDHSVLKSLIKDKLTKEEYNLMCNIIDSTNSEYINEQIIKIKDMLLTTDKKRSSEIEKIPLYQNGKGLPIGNMTSQFLSIFYLYELDHFIVNNLGLKYMVRYMDDYLIISNDKDKLKSVLKIISNILKEKYKLNVNYKKTKILDSYHGFDYLGYNFRVIDKKTIISVKKDNLRRRERNIKKIDYLYNNDLISFKRYFNSIELFGNLN